MRNKKIKVIVIISLIVFILVSCACSHDWQDATCYAPKTCSKCNESEGEKLSHVWTDATCTTAVTCSICGEVAGNALGHKWQDATCTAAKNCLVCGIIEGEVKEHDWQDATCAVAKTCKVCGTIEGNPKGHSWINATYSSPKTCSACGVTEGSALVKPETKVVGIYQMTYLDDFSTVTETLQFYSDGSVVHRCNVNDGDGYGTWSISGNTISFSLYFDGADHTDYHSATIVDGGIMWESSFLKKIN